MALSPRWWYRALFLLIPLLLIILAYPRLKSGIALEAAFPVPDYMTSDVPLPRDAYRAAATALSHVGKEDGRSKLLAAETTIFVGRDPLAVEQALRYALSRMPASARGWLVLAERLSFRDRKGAASALTRSLSLGSFESALMGRQARLAARLWDDLSDHPRRTVLRQVETLWATPLLRSELSPLLAVDGGGDLIARAFLHSPKTHQAVIEWVDGHRQRTLGPRG